MSDSQPPVCPLPDPPPVHSFDPRLAFTLKTSLAEAQRHVAVRDGFMDGMLTDPRVPSLFTAWMEDFTQSEKDPNVSLWLNLERIARRNMEHVVRVEFNIPWPWVAEELLGSFLVTIQAYLNGPRDGRIRVKRRRWRPTVKAPRLSLTIETETHESLDHFKARVQGMMAAFDEFFVNAERIVRRHGRRPKRKAALLRRWGRWYYDRHIRQPRRSVSEMAREQHAAKQAAGDEAQHPGEFVDDCDCRKAVRRGLTAAGRLLALPSQEWAHRVGENGPT
jgi:hypothetical protein